MANEDKSENIDGTAGNTEATQPFSITVDADGDKVTMEFGKHRMEHIQDALDDGTSPEVLTTFLEELLAVCVAGMQQIICPPTTVVYLGFDPEELAAAMAASSDERDPLDVELDEMLDEEERKDPPA